MKNTNKGFTLVELIVVITILAILGTIAFISLQGYSQDAKNSKVASDVRTIVTAIETKLTEAKANFIMGDVVDTTNDLSATNANWVSWTYGSGAALGTVGTYKVGGINFVGLRQNGADFKDNDGNPYVAAIAIKDSDNAFYQVAGQQKNADGSFTAVVKGNYVQVAPTDATGLISEKSGNTWITNGQSPITTLY